MVNNDTLSNGYQTVEAVFRQKTTFYIPRFQRGYRWTKDNVEKLIEDIFEGKWLEDDVFEKLEPIFNKKLNNKIDEIFAIEDDIIAKSPYCIQPLAICEDEVVLEERKEKEKVFSVIDGQQRLTTLQIVISALKSFSENQGNWPSITIKYETRMKSASYLDNLNDLKKNAYEKIEAQKEDSLDYQYMFNAFRVAKDFFKAKLAHIGVDGYREKYIAYLRDIILYNTRFIWYKFDSKESKPQTIFDNFNSGKTSLTDSELIKAIFMDGNNYDSEDIEDKRIVISEKWDEIENELHDEDFWTFVPHAEQYNTDSKAYDTRIDLIFEYLVSRKWNEIRNEEEKNYNTYIKAKRVSSQDHYLFELVNRWIEKTIAAEARGNTSKAQVMGKCWAEVRNIYLELRELYKEDLISGNENQIYNMVGLYVKLENTRTSTLDYGVDRQGNIDEETQEDIAFRIYDELVKKVINESRSKRKNSLKELIYGALGYEAYYREAESIAKADRGEKIEYAIKRINYDDDETNGNRPAIKTLIAYNVALINQSSGFGERFNFRALAKQNWQKEHIFACAMKDEKDDEFRWERRKKALEALTKEDNDYINYVKYITGYNTKKDISSGEQEGRKFWTYSVTNDDGKQEEKILDEDNEESVKNYLNFEKTVFEHRDERDTRSPKKRMAKALKLRELSKEKLEEIHAIIKINNIENINLTDDIDKMQLYLVLEAVKGKFDKKTCFNNSELQKKLKNEIRKCVREANTVDAAQTINVEFEGIKTQCKKTGDPDERIEETIESNWYSNYREDINRGFFKYDEESKKYSDSLLAFSDIKSEYWNKLKKILVTMKEAMMAALDEFFDNDFAKYLKDNSLGNMALLTAGTKDAVENQASKSKTDVEVNQNSSVKAGPFYQKKVDIINFSKAGKFVPIGTVMVFSGAFDDDSGASDYWLHNCRKKYLENIIDTLKKFLN